MKEVICAYVGNYSDELTHGEVYQVLGYFDSLYRVYNDKGYEVGYPKTWFIDKGNDLKESPLKAIANEIGKLVQEKNEAYGNSFGKSGDFLKLLYPDGIKPEQYQDMLLVVRIFDKQMRIANKKDAFGESPYKIGRAHV